LSATSSVSPDASSFDVPNDEGDTTGFAPTVDEGPRKDANVFVAFDADSDMAGASTGGFRGKPASGDDDEAKVKGAVAPLFAPNPEKPPNFGGAPGC
jgi:hypothetical protein